jgi:hypothetical protein
MLDVGGAWGRFWALYWQEMSVPTHSSLKVAMIDGERLKTFCLHPYVCDKHPL